MRDPTPTNAVLGVDAGLLTVTVVGELDDDGLEQLQRAVLERADRIGIRGCVLDLSAVSVIDRVQARALRDLVRMLRLLGVDAVVVGLRVGVAATLATLGIDGLPCTSTVARARRLARPGVEGTVSGSR